MRIFSSGGFLAVLLLVFLLQQQSFVVEVQAASEDPTQPQLYVVYLGPGVNLTPAAAQQAHQTVLMSVFTETQAAQDAVVYNYVNVVNGFAALLTPSQAGILKNESGVLNVYKSKVRKTQTTRSWEYLGLNAADSHGPWVESGFGSNLIVGLLDTGIWPESKSFNDSGFSAIPARWKGTCVAGEVKGENFTKLCNKKLIGARYFAKGIEALISLFNNIDPSINDTSLMLSPRDYEGHGSHTSSTVAGRMVPNASYYGLASGTASGGVPLARIAMYKVCWPTYGCDESDLLAGFDAAVGDGVDVISISIGGGPEDYMSDSIAIGSFHAVRKGILVSAAGGNDGEFGPAIVGNVAPWLLTVAATTLDRSFTSQITLGNGTVFQGAALNTYNKQALGDASLYRVVPGNDIPAEGDAGLYAANCAPGSIDPSLAKGKIIICDNTDLGGLGSSNVSEVTVGADQTVQDAGGVGLISIDDSIANNSAGDPFSNRQSELEQLPESAVNTDIAGTILRYISSSTDGTARVGNAVTTIKIGTPPYVAEFSSQGPNSISPNILKPDISAPGVDILAAWSGAVSPFSEDPTDPRRVEYNLLSGTSMATPHAAGAAAILKSLHPSWSPAAIKSALMTTADPVVSSSDGVVAYGAGMINFPKAAAPGLIFDTTTEDYILFLCAYGYDYGEIPIITNDTTTNATCPENNIPTVSDLNYPSISISDLESQVSIVTRTVTNIGNPTSVYTWSLESPIPEVTVSVSPDSLTFGALGEKQTFTVEFKPNAPNLQVFGFLIWTDGTYTVRVPLNIQSYTPVSDYDYTGL